MSNDQPLVLQTVECPSALSQYIGDDARDAEDAGENPAARADDTTQAPSRMRRDQLLMDHFTSLMSHEITLAGANGQAPFLLVEGSEKPKFRYPGQARMPFNLVFRSLNGVTLGGSHYDVLHPQLGTIPYVMLTRTLVYPDQEPGIYYEAIFN
ncbi:DUF6916 family protein [Thalassospira lucentensis]|uniref:DUF6916 family protein n=1 Tax=Thalassospira lucentensis TaxID=168935 RepID=UPI0003B5B216|nr:hypothetical protein [Thalassospira lucentensis]RCK30000.1 hypothetical protein TH1_04060 [Thalassospira lucentensis MCCC 1A00383 = DSM 14000]